MAFPRTHLSVTIVAIAAVALTLLVTACGATNDDETTGQADDEARTSQEQADAGQPLSADEEHGQALFTTTCGACHTLEAAGTVGQIGPDLGDIPLNEDEVLKAIRIGGTGSGNMPADLYRGRDAQDVAAFVAASGPG